MYVNSPTRKKINNTEKKQTDKPLVPFLANDKTALCYRGKHNAHTFIYSMQ